MATFDVAVEEYDSRDLLPMSGGPGWTLDVERAALLVHDLQPYYVDVLAGAVRSRVVAETARLVDWAVARGVPVVASAPRAASDPVQRGLLGELWGMGPTESQSAETTIDSLESGVMWVRKRSYSAFFATDLAEELRRTRRDQLIVAGVFASAGILATTFDAFARDVQCFVAVEATADHTKDRHATALGLIAELAGRVVPVAQVLAA
ncbi:isochorismatase family protein [Rhodococcus sp. NPDC058514]|uniref:isochorismatase family protein n=1 Tax=unclassified Rhodococcus (in: high G+C Gram-positive bacteria) TaxID=192944 RepID=UPI0036691BCF